MMYEQDRYEFPDLPAPQRLKRVEAAAIALRDELEGGSDVAEQPKGPQREIVAREDTPAPDPDFFAWLESEGLTDDFPQLSEEQQSAEIRAQMDVWVDRRFAAMAALEEAIRHNEDVKQRRIRIIADHFDGENAALRRQFEYLNAQLLAVANAYPYPPKSKSRKLPFGSFGKKAHNPKLLVLEPPVVLRFAQENVPEAVEDKPTLRKSVLNEWWVAQGEPDVPGCEIVPQSDEPWVKVGGKR